MKRLLKFSRHIYSCQKRYVVSSPINISYSVSNINKNDEKKPSMIIIHGLFGSKKNFDSLAKTFSKETGLEMMSIDARNHGESEHSHDMDYESMAGDVLNLMGKLGMKETLLLGHSMGGKIAMTFALLHPHLVRGLIVVDIAPGQSITADTDFFPRMISKLKSIKFDSSKVNSIVTARKIASEKLADVVEDHRVRDFLVTNLVLRNGQILWRLNLEAIDANYNSLMGFPKLAGKSYDGKTIFIGGSASRMISDSNKPVIEKLFPNSNTIHIPGCGHWVHADNPQAFSSVVVQFINSLSTQ